MRSLYALTSRKSKKTHVFKSVARKERTLHTIFKDKGILAKQILTLGYAHKPDKILCIYEKGAELFSYVSLASLRRSVTHESVTHEELALVPQN